MKGRVYFVYNIGENLFLSLPSSTYKKGGLVLEFIKVQHNILKLSVVIIFKANSQNLVLNTK